MPQLTIDIIARFAQFQDALDHIGKQADTVKGRLEGAFSFAKKGAAIAGVSLALREMIHQFTEAIDAVDKLGDVAQETGVDLEKLATFKLAGVAEGIDFDSVVTGITKFNKALDESSGAFHRLGLDVKDFASTDEALDAVADRISQLHDGAAKTAIMMTLFGRAGAQLIPIFNKGRAGLEEYRDTVQKLGLTHTRDQIQAAGDFQEKIALVGAAASNAAENLYLKLVPAINKAADAFINAAKYGLRFQHVLDILGAPGKGFIDLFTKTDLENAREDVERVKKELEELLRARERLGALQDEFAKKGRTEERGFLRPPTTEAFDRQIDEARGRLASLVTQLNKMQFGDADTRPKPKDKFTGLTEEAKARFRNQLEAIKQAGDQQRQIEELNFQRGEVALDAHYANLLKITTDGLRAQIRAVQVAEAEAAAELRDADEENERNAIRGRQETLRGERERLQSALRFAPQLGAAQQRIASEQFSDSVEQIGIALKRETGLAQDAAIAENNLNKVREEGQRILLKYGADSEQFRNFQRSRELLEVRGQLADQMSEEADITAELANQEYELQTQVLAAGDSLEAQAIAINKTAEAKRKAADETLRLLDAEEKLILQTTVAGSAEREKQVTDLRRRRLAAQRAKLEASPEGVASQFVGLDTRQFDENMRALARAERSLQNQRARGEITTLDAMVKSDALRKQAVADQKELIAGLETAARLSGRAVDLEALAEAEQALQDLEATATQVGQHMRAVFESAFVDPFVDLVNGVKSADEALKSFFNNIAQSLLRLAAQDIAEGIFGKVGGGGGILSLFKLFSGAGGAGAGAVTTAAQAGITTEDYTKYFTQHAQGGVMTAQGPVDNYEQGGVAIRPHVAIFGEGTGPEAYVPLPDGRSIPVKMYGADQPARLQAGPSAVMQRQPAASTNVTLQLHPDAMHLTLRDWFESEMSRQMATR